MQVIAEDRVHDYALIERPVFTGVLADAPQHIAPRLCNQPETMSLIVFHDLEHSMCGKPGMKSPTDNEYARKTGKDSQP